ncbi:hypothetical protein [Streptomyces sp. NPDC001530]|uniref:hypothetical protein n=1 Tax=Streptomyces sp. NPDC001530 TaxID=3364582 RepID=UPI0036C8555B
MRRLRELLAVMGALAVAFVAVLLGAPSAMAGGPTSVLVVSPESAESASLYYSDKEYEELTRLLGEPGAGTREEPPGLGAAAGHQLNVTWLVHDVSPWRVDRVYPDSPRSKDVWIHTTTDLPSMNGYWHKAEHPAQVRALFKKLGVLGKPSSEGGGGILPAPLQTPDDSGTTPTPTEQPRTTTAARATTDNGTDWWWAIPGAAAGALLARVRLPRKGEPRQELLDA